MDSGHYRSQSTDLLSQTQCSAADESPLCFNKALFGREGFNVDRFVSLTRHRASLSQIYNDLRVYLKIVQNSMIELINEDYADFVNLSSNLAGLKENIDKLNKDVESIWNELVSSTYGVMTTAIGVDKYSEDLIRCCQNQLEVRSRISLIKAIVKLKNVLNSKPDTFDIFWIDSLADSVMELEVWYKKCDKPEDKFGMARASCLSFIRKCAEQWLIDEILGDFRRVDILLDIIALADGINSAVSKVMTDVIDLEIEKNVEDLEIFMRSLFTNTRSLRDKWMDKLEKSGCKNEVISCFMDKCLLTYVISKLDQYCGVILVPSNGRLFHRSYLCMCEFISGWPDASNSRTVLRMIRDKFNLIVYFKLETHQLHSKLLDLAHPDKIRILDCESEKYREDRLFTEYALALIEVLGKVWSDELYLPSIADKLWDFTIKIINEYLCHLKDVYEFFVAQKKSVDNMESWQLLCVLSSDTAALDIRIFGLAFSVIWDKFRELDLDVTPYGSYLSSLLSRFTHFVRCFENLSAEMIIEILNQALDGVSQVPRNYRWTKKPVPTEPSQYVVDAKSAFSSFEDEIRFRSWNDESVDRISKLIFQNTLKNFCDKAEQVLYSVEQTGSSLQKFKRRAAAGNVSDSNSTDTDEMKIRTQLILDLEYCLSWFEQYSVDVSSIKMLIAKAASGYNYSKEGAAYVLSNAE